MSGILLPEVVIFNTIETIIKLLRNDLVEHPSKDEDTILYQIMGVDEEGKNIKMNMVNYFNQAKKMILKPENLSVFFGYNQKVSQGISLHILLPSEQGKMAIGGDEGYIEEDIFEDEKLVSRQQYFTQTYESNYQIMITSQSSLEVNLTYNILKSMILMLVQHLELMGIRNPSLSGNDILMQDDLAPAMFFHKVINISFFYEHSVPQLVQNKIAKRFFFILNAINLNEETL